MAKKKVNKTQAVRDYLKDHPGEGSTEIATALTKKGIKITANYVSNIKSKSRTAKKTAKKAVAVEAAPAVVEKKPADSITLDQIRKVAQTINNLGGYQRMTEVLAVIKELGGVKKFKDLAEAMTVVEPDYIPF